MRQIAQKIKNHNKQEVWNILRNWASIETRCTCRVSLLCFSYNTYQACWHSDSAYHLWTKCVKHTLNVIHDWIFVKLDVFVLSAMNVTYVRLSYEFFLIFKMYIFMVGYEYRFLFFSVGKILKMPTSSDNHTLNNKQVVQKC